jgi:hypothetical protein
VITTHLILFFFNTDGGPPPTPTPADVDAPILLVRFAKMGIR